MHTLSVPPSDRTSGPDPQLSGDALREAIRATKLSNSVLGVKIGKSSGLVSLWLNDKYTGDNAAVEAAMREFLRDRDLVIVGGVSTVETVISRLIGRKIEEVRQLREICVITGVAGVGKSRGMGIYLGGHTLAIGFRTRPWHAGKNGLADDLLQAAGVDRLGRGQKKWETAVEKTTDSGRPLLIDDAHELTGMGLQCAVDWAEETRNPLILLGLPSLKTKLLRDARRARRVGDYFPLELPEPTPLVEHLITALAPDLNEEHDDLLKLCLQVARGPGAFGAVEKELKYAARSRRKKPGLAWVPAFRAAHQRLIRSYPLS
jgi:hypothetical protein